MASRLISSFEFQVAEMHAAAGLSCKSLITFPVDYDQLLKELLVEIMMTSGQYVAEAQNIKMRRLDCSRRPFVGPFQSP